MKRPYSLQAKDVTLNFVKDKYGPNERQDLGNSFLNLVGTEVKDTIYFISYIN